MPKTRPLYIRIPEDLRVQVNEMSAQWDDAPLTDVVVGLMRMGLQLADANREIKKLQNATRESDVLSERLACVSDRVATLERQIRQLEPWLARRIARCRKCGRSLSVSQVAGQQCPGPECDSSSDIEPLPGFEDPLEVVRSMAMLVAAARGLVASVKELGTQ